MCVAERKFTGVRVQKRSLSRLTETVQLWTWGASQVGLDVT